MNFFPKADAGLLSLSPNQQSLPPRPKAVGPIYDADIFITAVESWTQDTESSYPPKTDPYANSSIPNEPTSPSAKYLLPRLDKNERLRLSMLWYYSRNFENEPEFLLGLQQKACLAQESTGWDYAVIGILDVNVYIRLASEGVGLGIFPRGESLCAHTVIQPPGSVFLLPNLLDDWRFRGSPYAEYAGFRAYAGVPLRMQHETGESVGLGTLCVASTTIQEPLSRQQQQALARLADWIVADMVQCTRARRQRERRRLAELLVSAQQEPDADDVQETVLMILRTAYPDEFISLQPVDTDLFGLNVPYPVAASDLKHGLWEDNEYIDNFIINSNHTDPPKDRVVRFISAQCESKLGPSVLVVATKDFRRIFDDVDAWFIQTCATLLSQRWQKRLLLEVMRTKEKFLRGVSHQLRTPIHGILGAAELLTEDLKALTTSSGSATLPPEVMALMKPLAELTKSSVYLDTISTAGRELMSTVNSMITLNRWADIAAADRQYATHDLDSLESALVKGISEGSLRDMRTKPSIFFHHDMPADCDSLRIDLSLFRDSVLPLLVNAIQNTPQGLVTVTLSYRQDTKTLVFDVEDTGCGIHPDDQQRIFELYEKVGEHSTSAGLGLTLATKFSALLHGSVELVSSEINRGSHFRATFRDIRCTNSHGQSQTASQPKYLPLKFRHLVSSSHDRQLSSHMAKFLTQRGFTRSNVPQECFYIIDYIHDREQRREYLSRLPQEQVAICLIPSLEETELPQSTSNVVFVNGPFSTSTLDSAIQTADELYAATHTAPDRFLQMLSAPYSQGRRSTGSSLSNRSWNSISDEGYSSMNDSPILKGTTNDRPEYQSRSNSNTTVSPMPRVDETADLKLPTRTIPTPAPAKPMALIVDDNVVNLRILQMYCKKRGLEYRSAIDGRQAVEIFTEQQTLFAAGQGPPIELILMDLQMPVCDGISATQQIRSLEKISGSKSVLFIVTGQDSQMDREEASAAGADNYLVKPVGIKLLDSSLKMYFPALMAS
ncbi:hypothetical protein FSARC_11031 [Fusarium sarcochroum]|uniref:histidine kinase n=1 Tax=Fusarium sarcochroum TaxID=1208366 RepID=A0A8H4X292_9HYPO|nr:hypothetical protein FSARC_11031 [Fusarium sarcochroum]